MLRTHLKGDRKLRLRQQSFDNPQVFLGVVSAAKTRHSQALQVGQVAVNHPRVKLLFVVHPSSAIDCGQNETLERQG